MTLGNRTVVVLDDGGFRASPEVLSGASAEVTGIAGRFRDDPAGPAFSAAGHACPSTETSAAASRAAGRWSASLSELLDDLDAASRALSACAADYRGCDDRAAAGFATFLG